MNKVLSGEYADAKIGLDGPHRCLFIKCDREKILLVKGSVAQYALKSTLALSSDKIYVVKWGDGAVSTIRIEKPYEQFLISGCESGVASEPAAKKAKQGSAIGGFICVVLIAMGICAGLSILRNMHESGNTETYNPSTAAEKTYEWAVWDGEGEVPRARIIIQNGDANREYGLGSIHGAAYNATGKKLGYIQVSYGIYNEAGSKVGSCLANETNLGADTTWEYEAICGSLPNGSLSFGVDDVTYW